MEKRFQVFVSSTFVDLEVERREVQFAIQKLNNIPAGMELFPSATEGAWDVIERVIGSSDYYVLIIGGRYGSIGSDGVSFTQREYELAREMQIPILAFLHQHPEQIPAGRSEMDADAQEKLRAFRQTVESAHTCTYWTDAGHLAKEVVVGLVNAIVQHPRTGWARGDVAEEAQENLATLEKLRRENSELVEKLRKANIEKSDLEAFQHFSQGNDAVEIILQSSVSPGQKTTKENRHFETTWHDLFIKIAWTLMAGAEREHLRRAIAQSLAKGWILNEGEFRRVITQYLALELIEVQNELREKRDTSRLVSRAMEATTKVLPTEVWYLSKKGIKYYAQSKAILRDSAQLADGG